jgi:pimeloyl-ACP methyl ester carboxylesterase
MNQGGLRERVVEVAGIRSPGLEAGPPTADEAVLFIHGNPGSSRDWAALVNDVGEFVRAVAVDMPGFGRADKTHRFDYSVTGYARHIGGCMTELGIRRAHLVLHDFGGPWGLAWAVTHPEKFKSAVLINTGVWTDYRWHAYARLWRMPILGELSMALVNRRAFEFAMRYGSPRLPAPALGRMYDEYDRDTRRAILRLYRATDDPSAIGYDQVSALRPLDRPALVIWGKHDRYLPVWLADRQRDAFPGAHVVVLERSGHFPFLEEPEQVHDALLTFIRQHVQLRNSSRNDPATGG